MVGITSFPEGMGHLEVGAGYAYEGFTDELVNNGGGGVFNPGEPTRPQGIGRNPPR